MSRARFKKLIHKVVLLFLFLDIGASFLFYYVSVNSGIDETDEKVFDVGIVFFHGTDKQGNLSTECRDRLDFAVKLYNKGKFGSIICTGGGGKDSEINGAGLMKTYLEKYYVPSNKIFTETESYSTLTNWRESLKIVKEKKLRSCLLISSPLHILRINYIAKDSGISNQTATYRSEDSVWNLWLGCNVEFVKWIALIFLPEKSVDWLRSVLL